MGGLVARYRITLLFTLFWIFLFSSKVYAVGIGVTPGTVYFNNVLREGYAEKEVIIQNTNDFNITYELLTEGTIKDWMSFKSLIDRITVPAKSNVAIPVIVQPPKDAANGEYRGHIYIIPTETKGVEVGGTKEGVGLGVGIEVGADVLVGVNVTGTEILDYTVSSISVIDTEVGYPIIFSVNVRNLGNVRITPKINIEILNQDKTKVLLSKVFFGDEILPTTLGITNINVSSEGLLAGQYWADVEVYVGDELIKQELLTFDLMPEGALTVKGEFKGFEKPVWADVGEVLKIDAIFENKGELPVLAKFKGEVLLGDKIIELLESDEINVPVGSTVSLTTYFTPEKPGRYIVSGYIIYSKKYTFTKEGIINVRAKEGLPFWTKLIVVLFVILVIRRVYYYYKENKRTETGTISKRYGKIDENLEKIIRESKRLKDKIKKSKRRHLYR